MDPKDQKIKDLEGKILILEKSGKEATEAYEKLQGEYNKQADELKAAGVKIVELADTKTALEEKNIDLEKEIDRLKEEATAETTESPRPGSDDRFADVNIPQGKYLIIERIRYRGELLKESSPDDPVFSDLKGVSKEQIKQWKENNIIR